MTLAGSCYSDGADVWAPRSLGEAEVITSLIG